MKNSFLLLTMIITLLRSGFAETLPDTMLAGMWDFSLDRLKATMTDLGNATTQFPRRAQQTGLRSKKRCVVGQ